METVDYWNLLWNEYGFEEAMSGLRDLFPAYDLPVSDLFERLMSGDVLGTMGMAFDAGISYLMAYVGSLKEVLLWLLVLGIASAIVTSFVEIFDKHQVAEFGFYFMYMMLSVVLLKCYGRAMSVSETTLTDIVTFMKLLMPTYLLALGAASGATTAAVTYELLLVLLLGVTKIFAGVVLPMIYGYSILTVLNGVWTEEKLSALTELLAKAVGLILKGSMGLVTGVSFFQSAVTPALDSVQSGVLQKVAASIPGIGDASEGVMKMVLGSAIILKNSIGAILLILLLILCIGPLIHIFLIGAAMKVAAALMGIVSDKRMTACVGHMGDGSLMLFKTAGSAMAMFFICILIVAAATNRIL